MPTLDSMTSCIHLILSVCINPFASRTLMMISSVDRNSDGFAAGSRTDEEDGKD